MSCSGIYLEESLGVIVSDTDGVSYGTEEACLDTVAGCCKYVGIMLLLTELFGFGEFSEVYVSAGFHKVSIFS